MKAGINLFSLRKFLSCEADYIKTVLRLRDMGYSYFQFSGAPYDADMIARAGAESGLPTVLTHVPYDRIVNDTDALMEEHTRFGCKNIGLGAMPRERILDEKLARETVEELQLAAEKMDKYGFKFFYHHHHFEFIRMGEETLFDYMVKNAPKINFTVDTYWLQYGGVSIVDTIRRLQGRMGCIHLKDYGIVTENVDGGKVTFRPIFKPVGDGNIDFISVRDAALASGAEYFLVEQDNASTNPDPFGDVERSIRYIREVL